MCNRLIFIMQVKIPCVEFSLCLFGVYLNVLLDGRYNKVFSRLSKTL